MENTEKAKVPTDKWLPKPNNLITIPAEPNSTEFYKWWCVFLRPFIPLTDREIDVVSSYLHQRYELSKIIPDPALLDTLVMSDNVRKTVMDECKISKEHLYVVMSSLRKNNVFLSTGINPRLIPNLRESDNGCFQLLLLFRKDSK